MRSTETCHDIQQLISVSLDEPLSEAEQALVDAHLATCDQCALAARQIRGVDETLRKGSILDVPHAFTQQVLSAAFGDGSVTRGLSFGIFILTLGALFMSGLWLIANVNVLGWVMNLILNPAQVSELQQWGPRTLEALGNVLSAGWQLIVSIRNLLFGPLLIPSLIALVVSVGGLLLFRLVARERATET